MHMRGKAAERNKHELLSGIDLDPLTSWGPLGKSLNLSEPQFPERHNEETVSRGWS